MLFATVLRDHIHKSRRQFHAQQQLADIVALVNFDKLLDVYIIRFQKLSISLIKTSSY